MFSRAVDQIHRLTRGLDVARLAVAPLGTCVCGHREGTERHPRGLPYAGATAVRGVVCGLCQRSFHRSGFGRHRRACALRFPLFLVERDGKFYQEYYAVGFLWEVDGRWVRDPKRASKYPKTVAGQIGRERGGVAVGLDEALRRVR